MACRSKPYTTDIKDFASIEDLKARLPGILTNVDYMLSMLFQDLGMLCQAVTALSTTPSGGSTTIVKSTQPGPVGMTGDDGIDGEMGPPGPPGSGGGGGGLTNAQIAARILIDSPGGGSGGGGSTGTSGLLGPTGPTGPQGAQGLQGFTGVSGQDGEDGDGSSAYQRVQTFNGDLRATISTMFTWTTKAFDTVYQAVCDGFLVTYASAGTGTREYEGRTDGSNPPITARGGCWVGGNGPTSFCMPVKAGDFYESVTILNSGGTNVSAVYWAPLGTAG